MPRNAHQAVRRAAGTAALGAAGALLGLAGAAAATGLAQAVLIGLVAPSLLLAGTQAQQAVAYRREAALEEEILSELAMALPPDWYLLSDLHLPSSWGEQVPVRGLLVGPGGLVVVEPCTAGGQIHPAGGVWVATRAGRPRVIPSPINRCRAAAEAVREAVGDRRSLPLHMVVALADETAVYHPIQSEVAVVGGMHLARALLRMGQGALLSRQERFQLALDFGQFYR